MQTIFRGHLNIVRSYAAAVSHKVSAADWLNAKPFESIPGPSKYQIFKAFLPGGQFYNKSLLEFNHELRLQYGDIFLFPGLFGKRDIVFTFDPKDYQQVFRTEGIYPVRRGFDVIHYHRKELRKDFFKHAGGLVAEQGESWAKFRSAVNPALMNPKTMRIYIPKFDAVATKFVTCIRRIRDPITQEVPKNFETYINYMIMNTVALVALDTDLNLIENSEEHPKAKILIDNMKEFFQLLFELDMQPSLWKIVPTAKYKKIISTLDLINDLAMEYVHQAMERMKEYQGEKPAHEESILERLTKNDPLIATTMAMDTIVSGVDTTTSALTACLLSLSKNPKQQAKLREELLSALPHKDTPLSHENMTNLPYLRACIKESLRLYPVSTGNFRATGQDVVLGGYRVPANTDVAMTAQLLLRDPRYFEQPEKFFPERWLRSEPFINSAGLKVDPYVYMPFGFGPRICVGKRIVDLQLETVVTRLVKNFEIKFEYPVDNIFKTNVFNTPAKPLQFKFSDLTN